MLGAVHIKSLVTRLTHLNSPGALPPLSSAEIEAVQTAKARHNLRMARFTVAAALIPSFGLVLVDIDRYRQGLLHQSLLYQALLVVHVFFIAATVSGLRYMPLREPVIGPNQVRGLNRFLIAFLGSIVALSLFGILERGSTTILSIALMLMNLVFRLPIRMLVVVNVVLLTTACLLRLGYGGGFSSVVVGLLELITLSLVTMIAGAGLSRQMTTIVLNEFRESRGKQALQTELDIAARMQLMLLPRHWPDSSAFSLFGLMQPARDVGGDFFDHFALEDGRHVMSIADVCDKGVAAGLFGMMCKSVSRSALIQSDDIAEAFTAINSELCHDNDEAMFVTFAGMTYDPQSGRVRLVNAGHIDPLILRAGQGLEWVRAPRCPALGMRPGRRFEARDLQLNPGDVLLFMTDGVLEAVNREGEQFGVSRVEQAMQGLQARDARECIQALVDAVHRFASGVEQFDDLTCLALMHRGDSIPATQTTS